MFGNHSFAAKLEFYERELPHHGAIMQSDEGYRACVSANYRYSEQKKIFRSRLCEFGEIPFAILSEHSAIYYATTHSWRP